MSSNIGTHIQTHKLYTKDTFIEKHEVVKWLKKIQSTTRHMDLCSDYSCSEFNINYKCAWSPFENETFIGKVTDTIVSGHHAYSNGFFDESKKGLRLEFNY